MNAEDLVTLNEEIAGMARAGLPLDQGLAALAREMGKGRLQKVTAQLAADLQAGHPLPEAIKRQGQSVPPFYAGLVEAGIRSGRVSEVLGTLSVYARSITSLRTLIVDACFYPTIVLLFAVSILAAVVWLILPHYDGIFQDFGMRMPYLTELVLYVCRRPMEFFVLPAAVILVWLVGMRIVLRATENGRRLWAQVVYAIPVLGTLIRAARLAAFTDLLAILVEYGVPLPRAFEMAGEASSDPIMAAAARQVKDDLDQGMQLGAVLRSRELVPELIAWMTAVGEQRGTLAKTLHQVAELYRRQVEMRTTLLRSVLPPFLVLFTAGFFVTFFAIVMVLPMVKLLEGLSK